MPTPSTRAGTPPGTGRCTFQRVSSHGTSPVTTPGPATMKAALTTAARRRRCRSDSGSLIKPKPSAMSHRSRRAISGPSTQEKTGISRTLTDSLHCRSHPITAQPAQTPKLTVPPFPNSAVWTPAEALSRARGASSIDPGLPIGAIRFELLTNQRFPAGGTPRPADRSTEVAMPVPRPPARSFLPDRRPERPSDPGRAGLADVTGSWWRSRRRRQRLRNTRLAPGLSLGRPARAHAGPRTTGHIDRDGTTGR